MKLIAFEGPDRLGKTTQVKLCTDKLNQEGFFVEDFKIPWSGDPVSFDLITTYLKSGLVTEYPLIFQAAQMQNRLKFQEKILQTVSCDAIIVDRWSLSSAVYGKAQGIDANFYHPDLMEPDITFVFGGKPFFKEDQDALERNTPLQERVHELYSQVRGESIHHIDANQSVNAITDEVCQMLRLSFFT